MVQFQKKCIKCRKNFVIVSGRRPFGICFECQKKQLEGEIKDPEMKKMFDIPEDFYKNNAFLRDIKINYLRWGKLTDKQVEAFKKSVEKMKSN